MNSTYLTGAGRDGDVKLAVAEMKCTGTAKIRYNGFQLVNQIRVFGLLHSK